MSLSAFERFKLRMDMDNNNLRIEKINNSKRLLENYFIDDPSYREVVERIDKSPISARMNNFRKEGFLQPKMDIQSTIDNEFDMGDLLYFDEKYWLCTMKNIYHETYVRGEIIQCNNILKFQLPNDYTIHERKCVIERPYSINTSTGQMIQVSAKEYRVRLQLDDITRKIFLKQRFIIGLGYNRDGDIKPDVYSVDSRDGLSNAIVLEEGFLILNLVEDQYNKDIDNISYMVADFKRQPDSKPLSPMKCMITSFNNINDVIMGGMNWKTFTCKLYDEYEEEITNISDISFNWNIETDIQDNLLIVENDDNSNVFKIKCMYPKLDKDIDILLESKITLRCSAESTATIQMFEEDGIEIRIINLI